jgi:hypothetical protein
MHTFNYVPEDGEVSVKKVWFIHNSDLSGDVSIRTGNPEGEVAELEIPGAALVQFVADYVRRQRISEVEQTTDSSVALSMLEDSSDREILGLE